MDSDSLQESKSTERELEVIDELYKHIRSGNIAAVKTSIACCPLELRQKLITQYEEFPRTPLLIFAIKYANMEILQFLVEELKINIDDKPIRVSLVHDSLHLSSAICGSVPLKNNICFLTALQFAIFLKPSPFEKIKFLVDRGADVNTTTPNGATSLMISAYGDIAVCEFLIDKGVNIGAVNERGQTALHFAVSTGNIRFAQLLVEKGADAFSCDNNGDYPILIACCCIVASNEEMPKALLDAACKRADAFQLEQIEKYRRFVAYRKLKYVMFNLPNSRQPNELEDVKRELELGLELTGEMFGRAHHRFHDALHETARCYFKVRFYRQWLLQLVQNFQTLCSTSPDLDAYTRRKELHLMLRDMQSIGEFHDVKRDSSNLSLGFDAFDEFLETAIEKAANCSYIDPDLKVVLILRLIRLALMLDCDNRQRESFRDLVRRGLELPTPTGCSTLLMTATNECLFRPWARSTSNIVTLLLECGANVNESDGFGRNLADLLQNSDNTDTDKRLAQAFVEYGVHPDAVSREGMTIASCMRKYGIDVEVSICLKCLAARTIRRFEVPFEGMIPPRLVEFVKIH